MSLVTYKTDWEGIILRLLTLNYFCGWIAKVAYLKVAESGHRTAKISNGRSFVNCQESALATAGI